MISSNCWTHKCSHVPYHMYWGTPKNSRTRFVGHFFSICFDKIILIALGIYDYLLLVMFQTVLVWITTGSCTVFNMSLSHMNLLTHQIAYQLLRLKRWCITPCFGVDAYTAIDSTLHWNSSLAMWGMFVFHECMCILFCFWQHTWGTTQLFYAWLSQQTWKR